MLVGVLAIHLIAGAVTYLTIGLMASVSGFAVQVRQHDLGYLPYWRAIAYGTAVPVVALYAKPLVRFLRAPASAPASLIVERRAISFATVVGLVSLSPWLLSPFFFGSLTYVHFGKWSTELMSQQVLSPIVNGFLASTTAYLYVDWLSRSMLIPRVFPHGRTSGVPGAFTLGVNGRLIVFLSAVAFIPLFTMLGLARSANVRYASGVDARTVIEGLGSGSAAVFAIYVLVGVGLTILLARSFTGPLSAVADALRRIQGGDLDVRVQVDSGDELGVVEEGVNDMVVSLRERERILAAFGRVVEPEVRDRLLTGELRRGGELRTASIMFCDLRGFTALAETAPPDEVVATLNEFFATVTAWVRECGGFVDKFIGDAALVVFGLFDEGDASGGHAGARAVVRCALGLRERLAEMNVRRQASAKPVLEVAVALHTGEVLAGTIGADDRHEYTVIGDTVNIASRLQQVCKDGGHDLILSRTTFDLATRDGLELPVTKRDSARLRGRAEPVEYVALG